MKDQIINFAPFTMGGAIGGWAGSLILHDLYYAGININPKGAVILLSISVLWGGMGGEFCKFVCNKLLEP